MNKKKHLIVKANSLIESSYSLSLFEQRLIVAALAQIPQKKELDPEHLFEIRTAVVSDLLSSKDVYKDLKRATDKLYERSVRAYDETTGTKIKYRWVTRVEYVDGEGLIRLRFNHEILPFISDLKTRFTQYSSQYVQMFRSKYSIRIYEMCLQWKTTGFFEISVDEIRERFELKDRYKTTAELRTYVIDKAIQDINKFSDIKVSRGQRKSGRAISHYQFHFSKKSKEEMEIVNQLIIKAVAKKEKRSIKEVKKSEAVLNRITMEQRKKNLEQLREALRK
jgi:plasmid replication initiation protein